MDEPEIALEAACRLPIDYEQFGDRSAVDLVRRSGIRVHLDALSLDRIEMCLNRHSDWIDAWIRWSDDRRSTPGWSIRDCGPGGGYEVSYVDRAAGIDRREQFAERSRACAAFVDHEIRALADLA